MPLPERPERVPAGAIFDAESALWELCERNEAGARHGAFSTFRAEGELVTRGAYTEGKLDGTFSRFTTGAPGSRPLRPCCVPPGARELRSRYQAGRLLDEYFYDEQGRALCDDGTPWPERPPGVPDDAVYDENSARYTSRREGADGLVTLTYFDSDGRRQDEFDAKGGYVVTRRRFATDGTRVEQADVDQQGLRHGGYVARPSPEDSPLLDARVREIVGQHERGEAVGDWELCDAEGQLLERVAFGSRLADAAMPLVAGTAPPGDVTAERLWALAEERSAASPREALALAARALGKDRDAPRFEAFFLGRSLRCRPEVASERAELALNQERPTASGMLGATLGGAAPAVMFRRLALQLRDHAPAALDYFDAATALAPEQDQAPLARGLLCIEQGLPEGALLAAALIARESEPAAAQLRDFCRIAYGGFVFRPAFEAVAVPEEELVELAAAQPLAAVRRTVGLYATRLALVRAELGRRANGEPPWLPPDTRALLPDGPVELRHFTARIEDEDDDGPQISEVPVDERVDLERSTRDLMQTARSDWAALGWLCWSVGLDEVALPERLDSRPNLAAAVHQATLRCWRAHDRVRTRGLVALSRKAPSFDWEGMAIDDVPTHLSEVVAAEYLETRAQFLWQLFEQNPSPFQQDLRRV